MERALAGSCSGVSMASEWPELSQPMLQLGRRIALSAEPFGFDTYAMPGGEEAGR